MRIEASLPKQRALALNELSDEMGVPRNQIIDEAVAFFLKAVIEVRKGRRCAIIDDQDRRICEFSTPVLTTFEYEQERIRLGLRQDDKTPTKDIDLPKNLEADASAASGEG